MGAYKQKWLEILQGANLQGWIIKDVDEGIYIDLPHLTSLKVIRDNIPATIAGLTLDIDVPKEPLKLIFHNGHETFEYMLNPEEEV